jgi:hypothetical protein
MGLPITEDVLLAQDTSHGSRIMVSSMSVHNRSTVWQWAFG